MRPLKRIVLAVPLAAAALVFTACSSARAPVVHSTNHPSVHATTRTQAPKTPPTAPSTATPALLAVPTDLKGRTMGDAKAELAKAGFTNVAVAGTHGGTVTDSDTVISAPEAGKHLAPDARVRLIAASPTPTHTTPSPAAPSQAGSHTQVHSRAACLADATRCWINGQHCVTGSCVNAARGLTPDDVRRQTDQWLRQHPGYCAYGQTGAVGPCDSPGGRRPGN